MPAPSQPAVPLRALAPSAVTPARAPPRPGSSVFAVRGLARALGGASRSFSSSVFPEGGQGDVGADGSGTGDAEAASGDGANSPEVPAAEGTHGPGAGLDMSAEDQVPEAPPALTRATSATTIGPFGSHEQLPPRSTAWTALKIIAFLLSLAYLSTCAAFAYALAADAGEGCGGMLGPYAAFKAAGAGLLGLLWGLLGMLMPARGMGTMAWAMRDRLHTMLNVISLVAILSLVNGIGSAVGVGIIFFGTTPCESGRALEITAKIALMIELAPAAVLLSLALPSTHFLNLLIVLGTDNTAGATPAQLSLILPSPASDGDTCPICLAGIRGPAARFPCGHLYHDACAGRMLESRDACAVCRAVL